ncbi:hypothetical protein HKD37_09G025860 [Glycine soja]
MSNEKSLVFLTCKPSNRVPSAFTMQPDILNKQPVLFSSPRSLPPYLLLYDTSTHMASHNFPPIHGIRLEEQHSVRMQRWQCWWLALTWSTWKLRNNIVFSNATFNANKLFEDAIFTLWTWLRHFEKDFTIHFNQWSSSIRHGFCISRGYIFLTNRCTFTVPIYWFPLRPVLSDFGTISMKNFNLDATFLMWTWLHNLEKDFTLHFSQWSKEVISIGRVTQEVFERIAATSIRTEQAFESIAATTTRIMATDPTSPPQSDGQSEATSKRSRTTTQLRTLTLRTVDQPRPAVYVDPATGRASGPMREKFHSYLGVVAREKVPIINNNWKDVPETLKEIVWNDILEPEFLRDVDGMEHSSNSAEQVSDSFLVSFWIEGHIASWLNNLSYEGEDEGYVNSSDEMATEGQQTQDVVTKYGLDPEAWKQFEETRLTPNWEGIRKRAQSIQKHNDCPHVLSRGGYDLLEKKLLDQKRKRIQEEALLSENPASVDEPPSPIKRHVKWKVARTRAVGNMTSDSAQEIADKIDSLEEQVTQGSFVPHGRQDILNTAIGRPDHGGRVRAAGSGVTITQYYGRASRTCSSSSTSISQQQLDEVVARLREDMTGQIREELRTQIKEELRTQLEEENRRSLEIMTNALKEAIKKELSNKGSQEALQIQPDIQQLGVRVSTQGSNVVTNAQASQEHDADAIPLMGLFVQRNDGTQRLVAMGKIMEGDSIIHTVAYADDVVKVSVETVIDPEAEVPYATSEIQYVKQAVNTFVAWPTHLVKAILDEHPQRIPHNEDAHVPKPANVDADDPLRELMKYSLDLYDKPLQISFDGSFLGIVDASTSIFITYSDVIEIIAGDKSLNISVIQLWLMYIHEWSQIFSQGFMYAFLKPQSLVCSKDRRSECEQYLERWLKESDREVYIGPYFHHVMTKLKKTLSPETKTVAPKWIEVKSHVQTGCYECGYYIMHWIWNIIASDIKSDWSIQQFSAAIVPPSLPLQQLSEQMKCPQSLDGCLVEMILSFDLAFALIPLLKFSSSKVTSSTSIEEPYLPTTTGARATVVETSKNNDGVLTTDVDILPNNVGGEPATDVDRKQNKYGCYAYPTLIWTTTTTSLANPTLKWTKTTTATDVVFLHYKDGS